MKKTEGVNLMSLAIGVVGVMGALGIACGGIYILQLVANLIISMAK